MTATDFSPEQRCEIIRHLVGLGWSASVIASELNWSEATVKKDIQTMGGVATLSPERPKPSEVYAATFAYYAEHHLDQGTNRFFVVPAASYLKITELKHFTEGLEKGYEALTQSRFDPSIAPCIKLASQLINFDPTHPYKVAGESAFFTRYLLAITNKEAETPQDLAEARDTLFDMFGREANRDALVIGSTDGLKEAVERWITPCETLSVTEAHVVTRLYGLGDDPAVTSRSIGKDVGLSYLRIEQIAKNAIGKLRKKHGEEAARFFETVETLRENRRSAETRIEVLEATIATMQRERADIVRASCADNDKALIEALAVRDRIDGALLYTYKRIDEIWLTVRSQNCLRDMGVEFIGELVQYTEEEMLKTKNFGQKSLNELREILADLGLRFGMILPPELAAKFPRKPLPSHMT